MLPRLIYLELDNEESTLGEPRLHFDDMLRSLKGIGELLTAHS